MAVWISQLGYERRVWWAKVEIITRVDTRNINIEVIDSGWMIAFQADLQKRFYEIAHRNDSAMSGQEALDILNSI